MNPAARRLVRFVPLILLLAAGVSNPASADPLDPIQAFLASQITIDDNIFRLPGNVSAASAGLNHGKSDTAVAVQAGVKVDKSWSLQRVVLDASLSDVHYQDYGFLSYTATNYDGSWLWQFTPRVSGTVAASQSQSLVNYGDYRNFSTREVVTNASRNFTIDWNVDAGWHALGGAVQSEYKTSTPFVQQQGFRTTSLQAGGKWVARSGNWMSVVIRDGHGTNPGQALDPFRLLDNAYNERDLEFSTLWQFTGKSSLSATLTDRNHQDEHFGQRNFAGLMGHATYSWNPTGKLQLNLNASRDIYAYIESVFPYYFSTSYAVNDALSLDPVWALTANIQVRGKLGWSHRSLEGEVGPFFKRRVDTTPLDLMVGADWNPLRSVTVSGTVQHQKRDSTIPGYGYADTLVNLSGQWVF